HAKAKSLIRNAAERAVAHISSYSAWILQGSVEMTIEYYAKEKPPASTRGRLCSKLMRHRSGSSVCALPCALGATRRTARGEHRGRRVLSAGIKELTLPTAA